MRPHIKKVNGLWWCGPKGGSLRFHLTPHRTPKLAYETFMAKRSDIMKGFEKGA